MDRKDYFLKVVIISDTHNQLDKIQIPDGDILVHCGDLTMRGGIRETVLETSRLRELGDRFRHVVFVAGNHDFAFFPPGNPVGSSLIHGISYLEDDLLEVDGIRIYGSPWTPRFHNWAFMDDIDNLARLWSMIPEGLDLLVTHGPPYSVLDETILGKSVGCVALLDRLRTMFAPPRVHAFGHIHESYGDVNLYKTRFINAAICDENYRITNAPVVIDL